MWCVEECFEMHRYLYVFVDIVKSALTFFSLFPTCIPDIQAHRITSTKLCINIVVSPADGPIFAWKNSYSSPQIGCMTTASEKFIIFLPTLELQPTSSPSSSTVRLVQSCRRVNKAHSTISFACWRQIFFHRNTWQLR
jgi:hypothetical protein